MDARHGLTRREFVTITGGATVGLFMDGPAFGGLRGPLHLFTVAVAGLIRRTQPGGRPLSA